MGNHGRTGLSMEPPMLRRERECTETSRGSIQEDLRTVCSSVIVRFEQDTTEEALVAVWAMTC